jgi:hypothetical protein
MAQRGRPKKEGELKGSSVRIRPSLYEQLAKAAEASGESIATELEERLSFTFTEAPMRKRTWELLRDIGAATTAIEQATGKDWDKDLTAWVMLRETLANGPVTQFIPHPDEAAAKNAIAANAELAELKAERKAVANVLRGFGIEPDPQPLLGGAWLAGQPHDRAQVRTEIEQMDAPESIRATLTAQLDRLDELDAQIDALQRQVNEALVPYLKARKEARERLYGTHGIPDLPTWLTAPIGLDEPPGRPSGLFGATPAARPAKPRSTDR